MKKFLLVLVLTLIHGAPLKAFYPAFLNINGESYPTAVMDIVHDDDYVYVSKVDGLVVVEKATGEKTVFSKSLHTLAYTPTVMALHEGTLWIGTDEGKLLSFKNGSLTEHDYRFNPDASNVVNAIAFDSEGVMYVAVWGTVYRIDGENADVFCELFPVYLSGMICQMEFDDSDDLWMGAYGLLDTSSCLAVCHRNGSLEKVFEANQQIPAGLVYSLTADRSEHVWYSCPNALVCLEGDQYSQYSVGRLWDMEFDSTGKMWMLPDNGPLMMLEGGEVKEFPCPIATSRWLCLDIDDDDILIGTDNGVLSFSNGEYKTVDVSTTSSSDISSSVLTVNTNGNILHDLQGRRQSSPSSKGLYIKDGRKFLVK